MKTKLIFILSLLCSTCIWSQTTLFSENMGSPGGTTTIAANTFQNNGSLTYSNGAQTNSADVRNTSQSSTSYYSGASGGGNVYFTNTSGAYGFSIESINASNYNSLSLQFGYRKESLSAHATFSVDYWNGFSWTTLANTSSTLFNESSGAPAVWYLSKTLSLPTNAQINGLKIRFVKTGTTAIRIDDVRLMGFETAPSVTNSTVASITSNSATFAGIVTATGGSSITATGTVYSATAVNSNPILGGSGVVNTATPSPNPGTGSFSNDSGAVLLPNIQYTYKAYATKSTGLSGYGTAATFYTLAVTPSAVNVGAPTGTTLTVSIGADANSSITTYAIFETTTSKYVQSNGTLGTTAVYQTAASWGMKNVIGLSPTTAYSFKAIAKNGAGIATSYGTTTTGTTTILVVINTTGTLAALNTAYGTASSSTSFSVSGSNLSDNIVISAPSGFEISKTTGGASGYATSQTLVPSSGTVPATIIYVRLAATAQAGIYFDNISLVSANDGLNVSVPTDESSVSQLDLTISGLSALDKISDGTTVAALTGTPSINGLLTSDLGNVNLVTTAVSANFDTALVGTGKPVTVAGYSLSGIASGNYNLIQPEGLEASITPNSLSDIVLNNTSSTNNNVNIDYSLYQGTTLTSSGTGTNGSTGVFGFYLRDGGAGMNDPDNVPTELTSITFHITNAANIRSARLFVSNSPRGSAMAIGSGSDVTFSDLSNIIAPDNGQLAINLRVTFNTEVTDNQQIEFTITEAIANEGGSVFSTANAGGLSSVATGDINRIEVKGSHLEFVQQPPLTSYAGITMSPSPTVVAKDSNNNLDLDSINTISLTSSGTLSVSPQSPNTFNSSGVYEFSAITHSAPGTGLTLTAAISGISSVNSSLFNVSVPIMPTFSPVSPICVESIVSPLPTTSNNGISGTWSPELDNTQTTTYTFTPNPGQNATSANLTIIVNQLTVPTFNPVAPIYIGGALSPLPTVSNNGIIGSWSPALNNSATTIYTFTPHFGQYASGTTLTIVVNANTVPTFNPVSPICSGAALVNLPIISLNGITGSWSPALNNTLTTVYTFTPNAGQNATPATLTITVNPSAVPIFNYIPPTERGTTLSPLPTTSLNGITGSWWPTLNNQATTTYTFTPSVVCATISTLTIIITDPSDPSGNPGEDQWPGGVSSTPSYHDTQGKLEVSSSGQANYTLPVALPPSISKVGPTIDLVYSSGQNAGIAGEGWNINSISYITRTSTRYDIDGFKDGIDFDDNDKLTLDGQRLLVKSGYTYWSDGSVYETEVQSNTKIQLMGTGAGIYFIVTAPDGSRSWYGNYGGMNGTDLSSYYIVRFEDAEGNFILYNYSKPLNKNLCIDTIQFSANTISNPTPLNYVKFNYITAARTENAYFKGVRVEKSELLNKIKVYTNGNLFKEYRLTHSKDLQLGYQRVKRIQEFNGAGEPANPVEFDYNTTGDAVNETTTEYNDSYPINDQLQLTGDFDGDGKMDMVTNNKIYLKTFLNTPTPGIALPSMSGKRIVATTLNGSKLNLYNTIVDLTMTANTMVFKYFGYHQDTNAVALENTKTITSMDNTAYCTAECETAVSSNVCNDIKMKTAATYLEGDFNGDGISEAIVATYDETYEYGVDPRFCATADPETGGEEVCFCTLLHHVISDTPSQVLLVNLDSNASSVIGSPGVVALSGLGISRSYLDKTLVGDYNGDGKSDILVIKNDKSYKIYSFNQLNVSPWVAIEVIGQGSMDSYAVTKQIQLGDYNGDGKPDIMIPEGDGECNSCPEKNIWDIYYSNPNPAGGAFFDKKPFVVTDYDRKTGDDNNYYYPLDINKDGKTDLVKVSLALYWPGGFFDPTNVDSRWRIYTYINNIGNTASGATPFIFNYGSPTPHHSDDNSAPIPLISDIKYKGLSSDMLIIRYHGGDSFAKRITYIDFTKDVSIENSLRKVTQSNGGIVDELLYDSMESSGANYGFGIASDFYSSSNSLNYPAAELKQIASVNLVRELKNTSMGVTRYQNFKYNGYAVQFDGTGIIGFKKVARTAWYNSPSGKKIWNVLEIDPLLRGATKFNYTLLPSTADFAFPSNLTTGLMSKNENSFTASATGVFPYVLLLQNQKTTDYLTGVVKETLYNTYDPIYNLPISITNNNYSGTTLQGSTTTVTNYDPPSFGTGSSYYIGRPHKITKTTTAYGDTEKSEKTISYVNGNISEIDNNVYQPGGVTLDPVAMVEKMNYYPNGLLMDSETSATGTTAGVNDVLPRKTSYTYDPTSRFIVTTTDPEMLVSTNTSFHPLYGTILVAQNPFNQTSTSVYDNWGKLMSLTDNTLNLKTSYTYSRAGTIYTTATTKSTSAGISDGSGSIVEQDVLAREVRSGSKNLNGTWTYVKTEYDAYSRKYRTSEPYFDSGAPSQWSYYEYDDFSRPTKTTAYTGKIINTSYPIQGLTVTVSDSQITKTKTFDANGQVVATSDSPGGTINYKFDANGNLLESDYDGIKTTMAYDNWGRKKELKDSSSELYAYTYDAYGELKTELAPKGKTFYTYDGLSGRLLTKNMYALLPDNITPDSANSLLNTKIETVYNYNATTKLLDSMVVTNPNDGNSAFAYTYDTKRRLYKNEETQSLLPSGTAVFTKELSFDSFSRVDTETNSVAAFGKTTSKTIKHKYSSNNGGENQIIDNNNSANLWKINTVDARGKILTETLGNGITIANTFDPYGYASKFEHKLGATNVMTLNTTFDHVLGDLTSRSNSMFNTQEDFTYDQQDRLISWDGSNTNLMTLLFTGSTEGFTFIGASGQGSVSNVSGKLKVTLRNVLAHVDKDLNITAVAGDKLHIKGDISGKTVLGGTVTKLLLVETDANDSSNYIDFPVQTIINGPFDLDYIVSDNFESAHLSLKFIIEEGPSSGGTGQDPFIDDIEDGGPPLTAAASFNLDNLKIDKIKVNHQDYDNRGRITNNSLGEYQYDNAHPYQNNKILITPETLNYYNGRPEQDITYNAFKAPVKIEEQGVDLISFGYNALEQRSVMYYGNTSADKLSKPYRKYYSSDGNIEIKATFAPGNATTPLTVEFITYLDGNAYSAPLISKSDGTTQDYFYLHRDYQGSILAITNATGTVEEKRLFDPWGEIVKVQDGAGNPLTQLTFFDRGYTGHEHLQSVGLINMNARLYDPKLHRFLQVDNYVQDPSNTQNFNSYGYCVNNPLKYSDASGNRFTIATIAGLVPFVGPMLSSLLLHQPYGFDNFAFDVSLAIFCEGVTFGIGECATIATNFYAQTAIKAVLHAAFQGAMASLQGGKFWSQFSSGAVSSIALSFWTGSPTHPGFGESLGLDNTVGTLAFGAISGGAGSSISGGNFWEGAATGIVIAGFNDLAHRVEMVVTRQELRQLLLDKGYCPDDVASYSDTDLVNFAKDLYPDMFNQAGSPNIGKAEAVIVKDKPVLGVTNYLYENNDNGTLSKLTLLSITISKAAFSSYLQLAEIVGHELNHYLDHYLGCFMGWANEKNGDTKYADYVTEVNAWNWSNNWNNSNSTMYFVAYYKKLLGNYTQK